MGANSRSVPVEHFGHGRAYYFDVERAHKQFSNVLGQILDALGARITRKPDSAFRKPECIDLLRTWRSTASLFGQRQPSEVTLNYTKHHVEFIDMRLIPWRGWSSDWDNDYQEPGVGLAVVRVIAETGTASRVYSTVDLICKFNLHSLGRFYQRAFRSNADLLTAAIWTAHGKLLETMRSDNIEFAIPAADGHWLGHLAVQRMVDNNEQPAPEDRLAMSVRTFHTERTEEG